MTETSAPRIAMVIGSTRPNRRGESVGRWAHELAAARPDAEFTVLDVADFALPLYEDPVPPVRRTTTSPAVQAWADAVAPFDGYLFVTPEYNHSAPAALKNAIDLLYGEWGDKAAGFVSYGVDGGVRAVEQLRLVLAAVGVATVSATTSIGLFTDLDETGRPHARHDASLHRTLDQLVSWSRALRAARPVAAGV